MLRSKLVMLTTLVGGLVLLASPGCGPTGPQMGSVSGKVTFNGKPVTKGMVTFVSSEPNRPNATGMLQSDGSYSLNTPEHGSGALVGEYKVAVSGKDPDAYNQVVAPGEPMKIESSIPAKFENPDSSGLTAKVVSGSNMHNFDLK